MTEVYEHVNDELVPLPVRITSSDVALSPTPKPVKRPEKTVSLRTLNIAAAGFTDLLPPDPLRCEVRLIALGGDVVICHSQGAAQDAVNQTAGYANASGRIVPKANTADTVIPGGDRLWVASSGAAQVSMTIVRYTE